MSQKGGGEGGGVSQQLGQRGRLKANNFIPAFSCVCLGVGGKRQCMQMLQDKCNPTTRCYTTLLRLPMG